MADKKPLTKSQLYQAIAEETELSKKDVTAVFDAYAGLIAKAIGRNGAGSIQLPGLVKVVRHKKPATKARMGRNPATGEEIQISAKPATTVVKVRALKGLKDMI
jgi:nucleoid DNA-binding protein